MKKVIVVLLPVFWLVTFSYAPFESTASARPAYPMADGSPVGDTAPETADPCCFSYDQIRPVLRRLLWDRNEGKPSRAGLLASDRPGSPPVFIPAIPLAGEVFLLQKRWQFVWRTADSPRAPTLLA